MISRNAKCFCGSEKRYKHCHGAWSVNTLSAPIDNWHITPMHVRNAFHSARYELMIAACLVRAGFDFTFSDEEDSSSSHSDGVAVHRRTGKRYAVEMKTKGRPGILGKAGERPSPAAMKGDVSRQLRDALLKPAHDERLIFIDLNLPPQPSGWQGKGVCWRQDAIASNRAVEEQPGNAPADATRFIGFTKPP